MATKENINWKRINMGDTLPCQSFLRKKNGEILKLSTVGGVKVGQDCYYLPVDEVINVIKDYPVEESKDERIRKAIYNCVKWFGFDSSFFEDVSQEECLDWLEKHGQTFTKKDVDDAYLKGVCDAKQELEKQEEQKPADKVKPKFHEGDWIINSQGTLRHIINVDKGGYQTDGGWLTHVTYEKTFHLWTIQDAKDGDVLTYVTDEEDLWIMIYWSLYEPYEGHVHYHALLINDNFGDKGTCSICVDNLKPATKKQRELLFKKMHEAGYEWDAEKKELKKVEQKPILDVEIPFGTDSELVEEAITIPDGCYAIIENNKVILRKCEQKPWSEEDENLLKLSLKNLTELKDRFGEEYGKVGDCIVWHESIKDRIQHQTSWKPSREQMNGLKEAIEFLGCTKTRREQLQSLYEQLKKL